MSGLRVSSVAGHEYTSHSGLHNNMHGAGGCVRACVCVCVCSNLAQMKIGFRGSRKGTNVETQPPRH